jgi:uncharacterized membrane protein
MQDGSKDSAEAFERPVFTAVIRPHRSLGPEAFRTVMTLCCLATLVASIPFVVLGFWPVAGFFGLDMLALYIAFRVNFRRGDAFEELVLTPIQLLVRRVSHRGKREEFRFNPYGPASTASTTRISASSACRSSPGARRSPSPASSRPRSANRSPTNSAARSRT